MDGIERRLALRVALQARWDAAWDFIRAIDRTRLLPMPLQSRDAAHVNEARARYDQASRVVRGLQAAGR